MAVMGGDGLLDDLVMHGQQPQRAGFVGAHLVAEAYDVGEHDGGQPAGLGRRLWRSCAHGGDYPAGSASLSTGSWEKGGFFLPHLVGDGMKLVGSLAERSPSTSLRYAQGERGGKTR